MTKKSQTPWGVRLRMKIFNALKGESDSSWNASQIQESNVLEAFSSSAPPAIKKLHSGTDPIESNHFDNRWLSNAQTRNRSYGRSSGASMGLALGAICLLPFGPIAMFVCSIVGLLLGFILGVCYDIKLIRRRDTSAQRELKRLTYLVRFAADQIGRRIFTHDSEEDSQYCLDLLVDVIHEFKPFVDIAHLSPTMMKRLVLFHSFLSRTPVLQCLWTFVNNFLSKWATSLTVMEFMDTCSEVLYTLVMLERRLGLEDNQKRLEVIVRVEEFLSDPSIRAFYMANERPGGRSNKELEAVLVRDAKRSLASKRRGRAGSMHSALSSFLADDLFAFQDPVEDAEQTNLQSPLSDDGRTFFKSYKDFIDFDVELKHRMPILASEARFLYEKESEPLDGPGWDLTVSKPFIKVLRYIESTATSSGTSPPVLVRAYAKLPNTTMENVFYHISDTERRTDWDTTFARFSLVPNSNSPQCEVLYCMLNSPLGVTPRDFLQYRKTIVEADSITILMRSAEHPQKPNAPGCIRAETYISGYVIRQTASGCDLFLMSQTDIKGLIPKWIVNMMAAKAPSQWVQNLMKSCSNLKDTRFSGDEAGMHAFLTEYVQKKLNETVSLSRATRV